MCISYIYTSFVATRLSVSTTVCNVTYICIYTYIRVYIHAYIYIYIHTYMWVYHIFIPPSSPPDCHSAPPFATRHTYVYTRIYIYIYICTYLIFMCVCVSHMCTSLIATGLSFRATVCNDTHGRSASSARGDAILLNERSSVRSSAHPPAESSES